jgi:two-component system, chemotaxis family, protein-glutamate methylesterase/glutaminase
MPGHDIIVIGASAGGVQTLVELIGALPRDLPASVFIVIHVAPFGTSAMPAILSRSGPLPAVHPRDNELIVPGKVYIAPPDHHLLLEPDRVRISRGATENGYRPAVDVLFRTAAQIYGPRVVGVVLTGNLDDGTAGLALIKKYGGTAVVQDPEEADYPGMPRSAINSVEVDHILPLAQISPLLADLAHQEVNPELLPEEEDAMELKNELERGEDREGKGAPSSFTCPECGGTLFEREKAEVVHFRCRTGHAYSPESLLAKQSESLEATLWAALRALEENAALARRMERWMLQRGRPRTGAEQRYTQRAQEAEQHATVLRGVLLEEPKKVG